MSYDDTRPVAGKKDEKMERVIQSVLFCLVLGGCIIGLAPLAAATAETAPGCVCIQYCGLAQCCAWDCSR